MKNRNILLLFHLCLLLLINSFNTSANMNDEIRINVPSRSLQVIKNGFIIREYPVGVGSSKSLQTPPGKYFVDKKIINPIWEHPYKSPGESRIDSGERNPLGTRWIGFHSEGGGFYGIHGTNQPNSIGKFVSHGCVRMHNEDVEELFELIEYNTPVIVTYNRYRLNQNGNAITIEVFPDPYGYKDIQPTEVINQIREQAPYAQIDYDLLMKAIRDTSEQAIYEIALVQFYRSYGNPRQE